MHSTGSPRAQAIKGIKRRAEHGGSSVDAQHREHESTSNKRYTGLGRTWGQQGGLSESRGPRLAPGSVLLLVLAEDKKTKEKVVANQSVKSEVVVHPDSSPLLMPVPPLSPISSSVNRRDSNEITATLRGRTAQLSFIQCWVDSFPRSTAPHERASRQSSNSKNRRDLMKQAHIHGTKKPTVLSASTKGCNDLATAPPLSPVLPMGSHPDSLSLQTPILCAQHSARLSCTAIMAYGPMPKLIGMNRCLKTLCAYPMRALAVKLGS